MKFKLFLKHKKFKFNLFLNHKIKFNLFLKHKIKFKIEKYIFTIGAPRSGTTFLCQLLNNHPNILVSNEDRTIYKILHQNINFKTAIINSNINAFDQFQNAYNKNIGIQNKWKHLDKKKLLEKKTILIAGDKKSGQNAIIFNNNKNEFINLFKKPNIFFLQIVRNPINAAKSYEKSHPHEVFGFNDALEKILKINSYGFELGKMLHKNYVKIYYEDLVANPSKIMKELIDLHHEMYVKLMNLGYNINDDKLLFLIFEKYPYLFDTYMSGYEYMLLKF